MDLTLLLKNDPIYFTDVFHRVPHGVVPTYSPAPFTFCVRSSSGCGTSIAPEDGRGAAVAAAVATA